MSTTLDSRAAGADEGRNYGPCPSWCTEAGKRQHRDDPAWQHPDDRVHYSECAAVIDPLEVMEPKWFESDVEGRPGEWLENSMHVYVTQRWRESDPRMVLVVNDSTVLELTIPEARVLFLGISELLNAVE